MYRAKTKSGEVVKGYWCVVEGVHFIILESAGIFDVGCIVGFVEIIPSTLAQDTTVKDKNGTPIYGSFPVEGVMSKGGDTTKSVKGKIFTIEWERGGLGFIGRSRSGIVQLSDLIGLTEFDVEVIGSEEGK